MHGHSQPADRLPDGKENDFNTRLLEDILKKNRQGSQIAIITDVLFVHRKEINLLKGKRCRIQTGDQLVPAINCPLGKRQSTKDPGLPLK